MLHGFYTVTSVLMLSWYVRYAGPSAQGALPQQGASDAWDHGLVPSRAPETATYLPVFVPALEPGGAVLRMAELVRARSGPSRWVLDV